MNEEISVTELTGKISELMNNDLNIESDTVRIRPGKSEVERLKCNNEKILKNTNWKPEYNLEKGLRETINFIKRNLSYYKPEVYNV